MCILELDRLEFMNRVPHTNTLFSPIAALQGEEVLTLVYPNDRTCCEELEAPLVRDQEGHHVLLQVEKGTSARPFAAKVHFCHLFPFFPTTHFPHSFLGKVSLTFSLKMASKYLLFTLNLTCFQLFHLFCPPIPPYTPKIYFYSYSNHLCSIMAILYSL